MTQFPPPIKRHWKQYAELERAYSKSSQSFTKATAWAVGIAMLLILILGMANQAKAETYDANQIADAIYRIEGGESAKKAYGILSVSCKDEADCRKVCLNTIENNFVRWQLNGSEGDFLAFLASRYAPVEAHPLNRNWLPNLRSVLARGAK